MSKIEYMEKLSEKEMRQLIVELQESNAKLLQENHEFQESRDRYFDLYNFAPVGYMTMDENGIIIDANLTSGMLLGTEMKELVGKELSGFITEDTKDEYRAHVKELVGQKSKQACVVKMQWNEGNIIYARFVSDYVRLRDGSYRQCSVFLDITKCKQFENDLRKTVEALTKSNTELERFSYVASHDLREPLHSISSCTQLLDMQYGNILDDKGKQLVSYILGAVAQMNSLITDLLFYSSYRQNSGFFADVDCADILDYVTKGLQQLISDTKAQITSGILPTICADNTQIAQLFQNLISNAIKHHNGVDIKIHIAAKLEGDYWLFSIKDNGDGIENEYLEKIFEIFKRLEPRTKASGTGIGLAICQQVVEKHNGRIWVESKLGEGSIFYFTLPVKQV